MVGEFFGPEDVVLNQTLNQVVGDHGSPSSELPCERGTPWIQSTFCSRTK